MLTRTKVLDLTIAALLILTLAPGPATANAPVRGLALAAAPTTRAVESLNTLSNRETYFSDFSALSAPSMVQYLLTPLSTGDTIRVSVASDGGQGNYDSYSPSISADGRYMAFQSYASNLVSGDTNGVCDVFVHDRQTGETRRVSIASDGRQGNNGSWDSSISANGRYVAFNSGASNLVGGDTNGTADIFIHDRQTGQTTRVSVASDGTQGNGTCWFSPDISADGRYVAFESEASNLVSGDTNGYNDIFVHDRQTEETARVSVASDGTQGNHNSWLVPAISANGHYVAFDSRASNLVSGDTNGVCDVFVHDRQTGQTVRVSVASDGSQGNDESKSPSISADGRYVAFHSYASDLVSGDTNGWADIFVHDRQTGQTIRVSVVSDGTQGNGASWVPSISADDRYVAFESRASNLDGSDTNGYDDVFVHDWQTGETHRVSVASDGRQGNDYSRCPSISADGRYVAFESNASNLVGGDSNGTYDVFVHDRGGGPYAISGHVSDDAGNPLADVTISAGLGDNATTDGSGTYTLTDLITGTYTLTPNKHIYTFTPTTRTVSVPPDATGQDFTAPELENVYLPLILRNH